MKDLAAMLHPITCSAFLSPEEHSDTGYVCHRAAAAIAPRLTPDREALREALHLAADRIEQSPKGTKDWREGYAAGIRAVADDPALAASQPVPTEPLSAAGVIGRGMDMTSQPVPTDVPGLREALERIRDTTLDQPAAVNVPAEDWYRRLLLEAMATARRALAASPDAPRADEPHHLGFPVLGKTGTYDKDTVMVKRDWYERVIAYLKANQKDS